MKKNVGTVDSTIRIVAAIILLILFFTHVVHGTLGIIFLIVGLILLFTGLIRYCPLYGLFKCDTFLKKNHRDTPKANE